MTLQNKLPQIAIFASGSGSNAQALIEKAQKMSHSIACIITDKKDAGVIQRAKKLNTPVHIVSFIRVEGNSYQQDKSMHEEIIYNVLKKYQVNWIFLAGYMRILSKNFLNKFYNPKTKQNNVINIHPSLLPHFPGKQGYLDAYSANVQESGITVHFVDSGIDTGLIIAQEKFQRKPEDDLKSFSARGQQLEHQLYPKVLEKIFNNHEHLPKGLL